MVYKEIREEIVEPFLLLAIALLVIYALVS
jgi:hypothetical protein